MDEWQEVFQFYCEDRNRCYINDDLVSSICQITERIDKKERNRWERLAEDLKQRNVQIKKTDSACTITHVSFDFPNVKVYYDVVIHWDIKQVTHRYDQTWKESRMCHLKKNPEWSVVEDQWLETGGDRGDNQSLSVSLNSGLDIHSPNEYREKYDRSKAVQYAHEWWDDYNPKFRHFDVDCTNYVSQCLWAGGAPMKHSSDRAKGWWYRFENPVNWSFSWAVAHSLRWYLPTSSTGLRGEEVASAEQLQPGDIICYDFEGDGRWDHNTIVVDKDAYNMPLVNAHTTNSRMRYWDYRDSYAWTDQTQYKFYKIIDHF